MFIYTRGSFPLLRAFAYNLELQDEPSMMTAVVNAVFSLIGIWMLLYRPKFEFPKCRIFTLLQLPYNAV